jgi:hypothetical protein
MKNIYLFFHNFNFFNKRNDQSWHKKLNDKDLGTEGVITHASMLYSLV